MRAPARAASVTGAAVVMEEEAVVWIWVLVRWVVMAAAVALSAWVLPDVALNGGVWAALWIAVLIGLVNVLVSAVLLLLPLRTNVFAMGVLTLLVNGLAVWGLSSITSYLTVNGFLAGVGAVLMISIFAVAIEALLARLLPTSAALSAEGA